MQLITLDFETFYSDIFTLKKLTTEAYVRSPLFEAIGVGIKFGNGKSRWFPKPLVAKALSLINWDDAMVLAHNMAFDGLILSHHYGIRPKMLLDTMLMAKPFHHATTGVGLAELAKHYGLGEKGEEVVQAKGKRFADFTPEELAAYGEYCGNDCDLTHALLGKLMPRFQAGELRFIDKVLRTFTEPSLFWDEELLRIHLDDVIARKQAMLKRISLIAGPEELSSNAKFIAVLEKFGGRWPRSMMSSDEAYEGYLATLAESPNHKTYLFDIPTKKREATATEQAKKGLSGEVTVWALAKKDEEFLALQEIDDEELQAVIAARLGTKSTIAETRAARMLEASTRGAFPIALLYYAAHTGRLGGYENSNPQNFPKAKGVTPIDVGFMIMSPDGPVRLNAIVDDTVHTPHSTYPLKECTTICIRHCLVPPKGKKLVVADASQIEARIIAWLAEQHDLVQVFVDGRDPYSEFASAVYGFEVSKKFPVERFVGKTCIAEGGLVLTDKGLVPIQDIKCSHKVWDGVEWVTHEGVIYQGIKEVITYEGLTATPDHRVYLQDGSGCDFILAARKVLTLASTGDGGQAIRVGGDFNHRGQESREAPKDTSTVRRMLDSEVDRPAQPERWGHWRMPTMCTTSACAKVVRSTNNRDEATVHEPERSSLAALRWAGDLLSVLFNTGSRVMGAGVSWTTQKLGTRSGGQRRALYTGESGMAHEVTTSVKPEKYRAGGLEGGASTFDRVSVPLLPNMDLQTSGGVRDDGGTDYRKVYDIANAGPRHRFTVAGKLVFNCVLGLGFGTGHLKLQSTLAIGQGDIHVLIDVERSKEIVHTYRVVKYPMIPKFWKTCQQALVACMEGREMFFGPNDILRTSKDTIWLPNGMPITYTGLKWVVEEDGEKGFKYWGKKDGRYQWVRIYGPKVAENITQALARIGVSDAWVRVAQVYPVAMQVHDELVCVVDEDKADECLEFMVKEMSVAPPWAKGLPLAAEGDTGYSYAACK